MGFSIIIPVKAINAYIHESVPKILALRGAEFEVLILPNELPGGPSLPFLSHEKIRVIPTGKVSPAIKRDRGARESIYEYLAFIDDDAFPAPDWLLEAEKIFQDESISAIGGPAVTPEHANIREAASGLFYETRIGGGGMNYRYRPVKKIFFVDDFPTVNLLVRKSVFFSVGGFDSNFWPGEDTKFCLDLVNAGHRVLYAPQVLVWHHRREVFLAHLRQIAGYGKHRGYFAKILPQTSRRLVYFVPSAFLLAHIMLLTLSLVGSAFFYLWLLMWALYLGLAIIDVMFLTRRPRLFIYTLCTIPLSHLTYGWMFLRGFFASNAFKSQLR
jgi:GT2 family glycosyltransferase